MNSQAFQGMLNSSPVMLAGIQRLRRGNPKEGYSAPYPDPVTDPGSRYWDRMPRPNLQEDEPPNPFGGGGGPYVPGAMIPGMAPSLQTASVFQPTTLRPDKFLPGGIRSQDYYRRPVPIGESNWKKYDQDYPNPFGGGSAPYAPGAMIPGAPGNLLGMQRFA
jgi:hypothetical protein